TISPTSSPRHSAPDVPGRDPGRQTPVRGLVFSRSTNDCRSRETSHADSRNQRRPHGRRLPLSGRTGQSRHPGRTLAADQELVRMGIPAERVVCVDHHTAHAAAAYYGQANFDDDVLVLTCDGVGDGLCATVSIGRNGRLERLHAVEKADSIGNIYAMVTYLMGMVPLEHEYKLMGLAPYADPKGVEKVYEALRRLIRFDARNPLGWERAAGCPA